MSLNGCDIAWDKPSGASLAAAGFQVASLYVGQDNTGKNMTAQVVADYRAHGIAVIVNFEYGAQQMLSGASQGITDANLGRSQAISAGIPFRMQYFSADWAVTAGQMSTVIAYLVGARGATGPGTVGVYGPYSVVKAVHEYWASHFPGEKVWLWQTIAWSNGLVYSPLDAYQDGSEQLVAGIPIDYDLIISADAGQWPAPSDPPPPPPPVENNMPALLKVTPGPITGGTDVYFQDGPVVEHVVDGVSDTGYGTSNPPIPTFPISGAQFAAKMAAIAALGASISLTDAQVTTLGNAIAAAVHFPTHISGTETTTITDTLS